MRWLVTGYGPFENIERNITGSIAPKLGERYAILEVAYAAVDDFIADLDPNSFDAWLALGHANNSKKIRVETRARNVIGPRPDVRGEGRLGFPIREGGPSEIASTLWSSIAPFEDELIIFTDDAGGYLCNYVLYRALEAFPEKLVGFLHLPPRQIIAIRNQIPAIRSLMDLATSRGQRKRGELNAHPVD